MKPQELPAIDQAIKDRATSVGAVLASTDISMRLTKTMPQRSRQLYKKAVFGGFMAAVFLILAVAISFVFAI